MADDPKVEIERTKDRIRAMLKTVPVSVNNGSYDHSVAFKKAVKVATKLVQAPQPKYAALQQAASQLATYY